MLLQLIRMPTTPVPNQATSAREAELVSSRKWETRDSMTRILHSSKCAVILLTKEDITTRDRSSNHSDQELMDHSRELISNSKTMLAMVLSLDLLNMCSKKLEMPRRWFQWTHVQRVSRRWTMLAWWITIIQTIMAAFKTILEDRLQLRNNQMEISEAELRIEMHQERIRAKLWDWTHSHSVRIDKYKLSKSQPKYLLQFKRAHKRRE